MIIDDRILYGSYYSPVCSHCDHLLDQIHHTCVAFDITERIPDVIWSGRLKHKSSYPGDDGITFTPVTDETLKRRVEV